MDDAVYEYRDGRNLLTLRMKLQANPEDALTKTRSDSPFNMLLSAVTLMLAGGSAILCGKYMGRNEQEKMRNMEEVVTISQRVQDFCLSRGVDGRRAYLAGLSLEEMAGNVVDHGFSKDKKSHAIDVRVVHKNDDVILRIKDDCTPFDPGERRQLAEGEDITQNISKNRIQEEIT